MNSQHFHGRLFWSFKIQILWIRTKFLQIYRSYSWRWTAMMFLDNRLSLIAKVLKVFWQGRTQGSGLGSWALDCILSYMCLFLVCFENILISGVSDVPFAFLSFFYTWISEEFSVYLNNFSLFTLIFKAWS